MILRSRRRLLILASRLGAAAFASRLPRLASANPLGRPVGIQLYTVNAAMQDDAAGTLKQLREIGYGEVESAGFAKHSASEFRRLLDDAGLACPSAHLTLDADNLGPTFEDAHALGATFAASGSLPRPALGPGPTVTPAPTPTAAPAPANTGKPAAPSSKRSMGMEEAKRTADLMNRIGEAAKRNGLQYVYHNHDFEFAEMGGGAIGYDLLLRETDPQLVKFEIDCGWMIFAGRDPIDYFKKYPGRFPLIHVKDFLAPHGKAAGAGGPPDMQGAELGHGVVDYKPIFAAAKKAGLKHYFVEQEGPFSRMGPLPAARVDYDYLHSLPA